MDMGIVIEQELLYFRILEELKRNNGIDDIESDIEEAVS